MSGVIARVKEMLEASGGKLKQARISRESGVPESTLSTLLSGTYPGDTEKHVAMLESWLSTKESAAQVKRSTSAGAYKEPAWQPLPTAKSIYEALSIAHGLCVWSMAYQGAGVGKTTTAERYQRENANVWIFTANPFRNSETAVLQDLWVTLKLKPKSPAGKTRAQMSSEIEAKLEGTKGLLVIDEAQYLSDKILNGIRIMTERRTGVMLLGNDVIRTNMEKVGKAVDMNPVWSRVVCPLRIATASEADIRQYIHAWGINDEGIIKCAIDVVPTSTGAIRSLSSALKLAITIANGERASLSLHHFKIAWYRLSRTAEEGDDAKKGTKK